MSKTINRTTAAFIGDTSLLIRCAEIARAAEIDVIAVASQNPRIRGWAADNDIDAHPSADALAQTAPSYLFSVGNLQKLPPRILAVAREMAFNFHDGPLPGYAGLNVPTWALLAGETQHAVTWHEMTEAIDAGRIAVERVVPIAPDETVGTLNVKCFDAGAEAFVDLVGLLKRGTLQLRPQQGTGAYFGRTHRPPNGGWLDTRQTAVELARLVRSLDFGAHDNPIGRAWFCIGQKRYFVDHAAIGESRRAAAPGTVLAVDDKGLEIATSAGILHVAGIRDTNGMPIAASEHVRTGAILETPRSLDDVIADDAAVAKSESAWLEELRSVAIPQTTYPQVRHTTARERHVVKLRSSGYAALDPTVALAGFAGWLAMQSAASSVSFRLRTATLDMELADARVADRVLTVPIDPASTAHRFVESTRAVLARSRSLGPMARDIARRRRAGDARIPDAHELTMLVVLDGEGGVEAGVDVALVLDARAATAVLSVDGDRYTRETAACMAADLDGYVTALAARPENSLEGIVLGDGRSTAAQLRPVEHHGLGAAFALAARQWPQRIAVRHRDVSVTYSELERRIATVVHKLSEAGPVRGKTIGIAMARGIDMLTAMLAVATAGAAYLPLDPEFPPDRLRFMIADAGVAQLLSDGPLSWKHDAGTPVIEIGEITAAKAPAVLTSVQSGDVAYMLYTSGSTGRPKGVVVTSGNLSNFLAGMDDRLGTADPCVWLAVTSISFDISILELLWTVTRGGTVVVPSCHGRTRVAPRPADGPSLSLFYFAAAETTDGDPYRLLVEGAAFADTNGFEAVWTPERHFHAFGGTYPNAALTSAMLAGRTRHVALRAGSCVAPLHHPARIAEDWAMVDRLSGGRAGIAFASGWSERDFILAPDRYTNRKAATRDTLDIVRRLWRGEAVTFPGPHGDPIPVTTTPRPLRGEIPVWLTAAKTPETFEAAGRLGCNVLTHLLGMTFEEFTANVRLYRTARARAGHAGPGRVTLMLHTFVGATDEATRALVRAPMKRYLESAIDLIWKAAGDFPTLRPGSSGLEADFLALSAQERDALQEHAFNRYYETSGLFGAPETCRRILQAAHRAGADEIACLIDFGVPVDAVLESLPRLASLRDTRVDDAPGPEILPPTAGLAEDIVGYGVTHLQCTPSLASMLLDDPDTRTALGHLSAMMVGGEEMTSDLARGLRSAVEGRVINMYGPTETTIWSLTHDVESVGDAIPLGLPIANTTIRIENAWGQSLPPLMAGELLIGGDGVAAGYHGRPELTAERFITRSSPDAMRFYRTGDLVRQQSDGSILFLGRADNQVKIRGHRIELGEIEAALRGVPGIREAVVVATGPSSGLTLAAFYTAWAESVPPPAEELRRILAERLPNAMVPSRLTFVDSMPMTPNGKVDRPALAAIAGVTMTVAPVVEVSSNETAAEQAIRAAWLEVLGVTTVGLEANFFDVGGHSLLAIRLSKELSRKLRRDVDLVDLFRFPTIRQFAAHVGGQATAGIDAGLDRAAARRSRLPRAMDQRLPKMERAR